MKKRRTFTKQYKAEVVQMVASTGKSPGAIAHDLGLTPSAVAGWVKQAKVDGGRGPVGALTTEERSELTRLRKENKTLVMEREFLKKMSAFFARESA
jgi:transposase